MDVDLFRSLILSNSFEDLSNDLHIFDKQKCNFFYDESNNIRKLWLDDNNFNASIDSDFVLGGVMYFGDWVKADVEELRNKLRLQKTVKEMKFKHISKRKGFLDCLSEDKVKLFLDWLYQSDLYVHFSNVNNLYFAIIDIIDTIENPSFIPFVFKMKNELYKLAVKNYKDFYKLLVEYNYPNIKNTNIESFYQQLIKFINDNNAGVSLELEILKQGLRTAGKQNELVFLSDNPERTIIENYFMFYLRPIGVFKYANHVFDKENIIEKKIKEFNIFAGDRKLENYHFVDSIDDPLIQVSDGIVGMLGKFYTYVNEISIEEAHQINCLINAKQKETLKLFAKLLRKSEDKSKLLLNSTESIEEHTIGQIILHNALY